MKARQFAFLLFTIPPLIMIVTMNELLDSFTRDVGGVHQPSVGAELPTLEEREGEIAARYQMKEVSDMVALSSGRFQFMSFFLVGSALYVALSLFSLFLIWKHATVPVFMGIVLVSGAISTIWIEGALLHDLEPINSLLFSITRDIALTHYDRSFAEAAYLGARVHFAAAMIATMLAALAGSCTMRGLLGEQNLCDTEVARKRTDIKALLFIASIFMTFVPFYVAYWLEWPANFVEEQPNVTIGSAEEIRSFASGMRLYFGAGYFLALLSFAVPAIIVFSRYLKENGPHRTESDDKRPQASVFTREDISVFLSLASPILVPLLGGAIGL